MHETIIATIPATTMLSINGAAVYEEDWRLLIIVAISAMVFLGIAYLKRYRANAWIKGQAPGMRIDG